MDAITFKTAGANMLTVKGFTLVELMIAVAIVGILAGIAYPSYQDSVRASRRADAQGALLGYANTMERFFTENNTYVGAPVNPGTAYYTLSMNVPSDGRSYTLNAAPISADKCGTLTLTNTGVKGVANANTGITAADCW